MATAQGNLSSAHKVDRSNVSRTTPYSRIYKIAEVLKESLRQKNRGQKRVFCPLFNKK
jgi:hypothetical protein